MACGEERGCLGQKTADRADGSQGVRQATARRGNKSPATISAISRQTGNLYFDCCFPMFKCWQMVQMICPTLKANPNRSKGQMKGSGCQLVDLRSRPLQDLELPAASGPAISSGSGRIPQDLPSAFRAIMQLFRHGYMKDFLGIWNLSFLCPPETI